MNKINKQIINHIRYQKNKMKNLIEKEIEPIDKKEAKEDKNLINLYYNNIKQGKIEKANEILKSLEERIKKNEHYFYAEHVLLVLLSIIGGLSSLTYMFSEIRKGTFSFRKPIEKP